MNNQNNLIGGIISKKNKRKIAKNIKPITLEDAEKDYLNLVNTKPIPPITSNKGNKFIDYFTFLEKLETVGKKGISFWDFWENKSMYLKKKYVQNLYNYLNENEKTNKDYKLFDIFRVYFGSISIFKPVIAMNIYNRYKPTSILDFTMGWGGRLVGACALNIPKYTGIDLNKNLKKPYEDMINTLKELGTTTKIKLIFQDALSVDYSKINYDMVLTSPPYYNTELYTGTNKLTKEEWNENFYKPLFYKTYKNLKKNGYYILNVSTNIYNDILIKMLGKANKIISMYAPRANKIKQKEYKEFIYIWIKK
jgi:hypothetical protein